MQEKEVRAIIKDPEGFRKRLFKSKAWQSKELTIEDRLYDTPTRTLKAKGEKLRIRTFNHGAREVLCWKGKKNFDNNVKSREEVEVGVGSQFNTAYILQSLGFFQTKVIKRKARYFSFGQTKVKLEYFPVEDVWLAEIEGDLKGIEKAKALFPDIEFGPYTLNSLLKKLKEE